MPPEKPPPRRKSCGECVRSKRRCSLGIPKCARCLEKSIPCEYETLPALPAQTFESTTQFWPLGPSRPSSPPHIVHLISFPNPNVATTIDVMDLIRGRKHEDIFCLDKARLMFCVQQFRSYPRMLVKRGYTPFIHHNIYDEELPRVMADVWAVCALYNCKNPANEATMWKIVDDNIARILSMSSQRSLVDHLACVQALILYHIIRVCDGDTRQRAKAEDQEWILTEWTEQLRNRIQETPTAPITWDTQSDVLSWEQWCFCESTRRTVIMSSFLRGVYEIIKRGHCSFV